MLVLTRRLNEGIVIGDDIRIKVVSVRGGKVKLGIDAPKGVSVHRDEVYATLQQLKESSCQNSKR